MDKTKIHKMWIADQGDGTYTNPILYTDYSDPDAIRVGEDYFMIASSFCNTPAVPLLHSKDLVNWKVINYIIDKLPFDYYDKPVHGCGTWAPAIRYHEGTYYVFIPMPDEGIMMCKTTDPFGKWSEPAYVRKVVGWIDPCPFWDEDGKAYMVTAFARSRIGFKSMLYMSPIEPDCSGVLDDGQFIYDGHATQPTIEGPKLYKRNGYYYIFAPAGGVKPGWQTVLRSKNIYGPWEEKIVLHQGNSPVNGPHQGAWVDTPDGQDWFLHFQDVGNAGRIVHLQPMHWENDWPVIGVNAVDGCGEPVLRYKKPEVGAAYPIDTPEDSDFFEGENLGLQWQWNANYKKEWYDLENGQLILHAQAADPKTQLCDISNLLLQKWPAPEFSCITKMNISGMADGDNAGFIHMGMNYLAADVTVKGGKMEVYAVKGVQQFDCDQAYTKETKELLASYDNLKEIYFRYTVKKTGTKDHVEGGLPVKEAPVETVTIEISTDGKEYTNPVSVIAKAGRWVGVKSGVYVSHDNSANSENKGFVTVDYVRYSR